MKFNTSLEKSQIQLYRVVLSGYHTKHHQLFHQLNSIIRTSSQMCTNEPGRNYFEDEQNCLQIEVGKPIIYLSIDKLGYPKKFQSPELFYLTQVLIHRLCQKRNARLRFQSRKNLNRSYVNQEYFIYNYYTFTNILCTSYNFQAKSFILLLYAFPISLF